MSVFDAIWGCKPGASDFVRYEEAADVGGRMDRGTVRGSGPAWSLRRRERDGLFGTARGSHRERCRVGFLQLDPTLRLADLLQGGGAMSFRRPGDLARFEELLGRSQACLSDEVIV